jgi:two-component system, NtrC family, sensor histidine kinase HydH
MSGPRDRVPPTVRALAIAAAVIVLAALHYTAGHHGDAVSAHHLYRRLFYLPILAAAWGWGVRGGLTVAASVVAVYVPHAFGLLGAHADPASTIDKTAEILLYVGIGGLVGWFVDRERGTSGRLRSLLGERDRTIDQRDAALTELRTAQEVLVQSEHQAAMGFLTAGLAHEIRNPLGAIRGGAEILGQPDVKASRVTRVAELLVQESDRLDGVLTRFLRFARRERGDVEPANLSELVDEVLALVEPEASQRGVAINHLRCSATPVARLDTGAVRQVLLNLVVNAMQVQPEGGSIRLLSGLDDGDDALPLFARVEDAGPGVPLEDRAAIFHPYYSTRPDGTGLGLSISQGVVTEHGGTLRVSDGVLGGACFELRLPRSQDPEDADHVRA